MLPGAFAQHSATREPRANGEPKGSWWAIPRYQNTVLPESQGLMVSNGSLPTLRPHTQRHGSWDSKPSLHRCQRPWWEQGNLQHQSHPPSRLKRVSSKSTPPESRASKGLKALSFLSPGTTTKAEPATGVTHPTYSTDTDTDPITPRQLEKELRLKWAQRLVSLLAPFADKIPNMASASWAHTKRGNVWTFVARHEVQDITDPLPGTGKPSTQRASHRIPWTESDVREHLNRMRVEEASPHKHPTSLGDTALVLQTVWLSQDRWACERAHGEEGPPEEGVDTVAKPQRKAILPTKEVIWTLEEVAAGSGQTRAGSGENMSAHAILDQYICGVVRFQVAWFNDLQHTIPMWEEEDTSTGRRSGHGSQTPAEGHLTRKRSNLDPGRSSCWNQVQTPAGSGENMSAQHLCLWPVHPWSGEIPDPPGRRSGHGSQTPAEGHLTRKRSNLDPGRSSCGIRSDPGW